jgi:branched-chain amino acid transport system permease protein
MATMIDESRLELNGKGIHLRRADGGDDSYPLLFCLHGNLGSGRWFEPLMAAYPGRSIAPDLPNFGQSDHIGGWEIADYARWAGQILHSLGISSAAVLGHSLGGAVAMELAYQKPSLVRRLLLVDSSPVEGLITPKEHYPIIEAYKADKAVLAQALKTVVPTLEDEAQFAALVDDAWAMNRDCFIGHAETLGTADFREKLAGMATPVDVFYGSEDILINDERAGATAAFFSTEAIRFENCGHSPMVEQPARFAETIRDILSGA